MRDIRSTLAQGEIDSPKFEHITDDTYGRDQKCCLLPRRGFELPGRPSSDHLVGSK
jgi:hypothetical protein